MEVISPGPGTFPETSIAPLTGTGSAAVSAAATAATGTTITAVPTDASTHKKFYTITATLRETYDTNVGTNNNNNSSNNQGTLETSLSPSVLVDFPMDSSEFTGRYTLGLTYYQGNGQTGGGTGGTSIESTHELVAQYKHTFSERFDLNLAEQFRYYTEPSLFESTGTAYRNGAYVSNAFNAQGAAQWTPLLGSTASYTNTVVKYQDSITANQQDSVENTFTPGVSLSVLPKLVANFGGIVDNITYNSGLRGYTNLTGFGGLGWQVLPSLGVAGAVGGSHTETAQSVGYFSPYAVLSVSWTLGARSSLTALYSHEVVPTDQASANGQAADRASTNFKYDINPSLTVHVAGIITHSEVSQSLITTGSSIQAYSENQYALDLGGSYHVNSHLDLEAGYDLTGVVSPISTREYTRNQVYCGVRGTY